MKSTCRIQKNKFLSILFSIFACAFFYSCGLDSVITVNEPYVTYNSPLYSSEDYLTWYFDFRTQENQDIESPNSFVGTEIYYKIYNNYSNLLSQRNAILSVNSASNGTSAATKMIDTYSYQPLGTKPVQSTSVFIPNGGSNRRVVIRLKTYTGQENYSGDNKEQFVSCVKIENVEQPYIPYRNGNSKSFDFFDDDDSDSSSSVDVEPEDGDADFYYSSSASESDTYYVQMFAVSVAFSTDSLANTYSLVLDLGSVPIRKGE